METTNPTGSPVTTPELDVARALEDAAAYLDTHGWCQTDMYQDVPGAAPRACALGAINIAVFNEPVAAGYAVGDDGPAGLLVRLAICEFADYLDDGIYRTHEIPARVVWEFNDHSDTTHQLVIRALRAAAQRHRDLGDTR